MAIKKTLGGDRLGSGNRMHEYMHNFKRSNKNLSCTFGSTMAPGVLYPCYTNIALKGDSFDIDLNAFVRTLPTEGPLYGSYKLQVDFFQVPFRLYQAIIHNNTLEIANKMNQVYLPQLTLPAYVRQDEDKNGYRTQINETCLMKYLNMSGCGSTRNNSYGWVFRDVLAIPTLAYYDIFKNYYANKQEENAYVITPAIEESNQNIISVAFKWGNTTFATNTVTNNNTTFIINNNRAVNKIVITGTNLNPEEIVLQLTGTESGNVIKQGTLSNLQRESYLFYDETAETITIWNHLFTSGTQINISAPFSAWKSNIKLEPFPLSNIDKMRQYLLTRWDLGEQVKFTHLNMDYAPYSYIVGIEEYSNTPYNTFDMNGLVVKTYQSDMFNNWLDTEWVNEITLASQITVDTYGSFSIDMLNFKKKLYDHLNRLAISGGTYDDWQEATYGDKVWGKAEKPIYCGGMSSEVIFDEVISTSATQIDGYDNPLGSLAGRGTLNGRQGGHIKIKVGEASVIMGIVSLTPRIFYTQGNAWYNTELKTMDDLHKPIFDRIGFEDLLVERMAWWDAKLAVRQKDTPEESEIIRSSAGKQPAWMNYQTDVDKAYGEFAKPNGVGYMILQRSYEQDQYGLVQDVTTYIDPSKFNYAFANANLNAQNFWTFVKMKIHARRKMSNTQIPNV